LSNTPYGASTEEWEAFTKLFGDAILPSVCSPEAKGTPNSSVGDVFKTPSAISKDGVVYRMKAWATHKATRASIAEWSKDGRIGICATTRDIQAIDCDCATPELTAFVVEYFAINIGQNIPLRVGKAGRGTLLLRIESPEPIAKSKFVLKNDGGAVELLGSRQQTMLAGTHKDGMRYYWPDGLPTSVPAISLKDFKDLWDALAAHLGDGSTLNVHGVNERSLGSALSAIDPFSNVLREAGIVRADAGLMLHLECPWASTHSGPSGLTSSSYMLATTTQPANYRCLHTHCADKNVSHLHQLFSFSTAESDFSDVALVDPADITAPPWHQDPRWVRRTNKDKDLIIDHKVYSNVQLALEYPQLCDGLKLQYDTFSGTTTVWDTNAGKEGTGYMSLTDGHVTRIRNALSDNPQLKLTVTDKELSAQITVFQDKHGVDCAMNALENVAPWDGILRLRDFASTVMGTEKNEYTSDVGLYMFLSITARIYLKDVSIDAIPVLIGLQKSRKSRLVKALSLVPEHYSKVNFKDSDADKVRFMAGRSVVNWDELSGVSRADLSAIKTFITETKDTIVPKYSNRAVDIARRSVIIATTNDQRFLKDPTGNRRFFPVNVGVLSEEMLAQMLLDKEQYYAEALHMLKANPSSIHDVYNRIDDSTGAAAARRRSLEIANEHPTIIEWLDQQGAPTTVSAVSIHHSLIPGRGLTKMKLIELGQSLITLGYECVDLDTHTYKNNLQSLE
jgi:hypothetical protein